MFLWKAIMPLMFPVIIVFICIRIDRFLLFEILSKDICCESWLCGMLELVFALC